MGFPIDFATAVDAGVMVAQLHAGDASDLFAAIDHGAVWTHIPGARPCNPDPAGIEVGSTLLSPTVWGKGVNAAAKKVILAAAFGAGGDWVQLRTDERNCRSATAILKLPGVVEIESRVEPQWIRADGTVRTSRMFRIPRA